MAEAIVRNGGSHGHINVRYTEKEASPDVLASQEPWVIRRNHRSHPHIHHHHKGACQHESADIDCAHSIDSGPQA